MDRKLDLVDRSCVVTHPAHHTRRVHDEEGWELVYRETSAVSISWVEDDWKGQMCLLDELFCLFWGVILVNSDEPYLGPL